MRTAQPYYLIGQWRLSSDRQLRAFVCSRRGTLHLTRVYDDRDEMTSEKTSDCDGRIFPDLFRRLEDFDLKFPGLRTGSSRSEEATDISMGESATAQQHGVESSGRFGELLVREQMITHEQLEIGEVLLKAGRITASQLADGLDYQRRASIPIGQVFIRLGWLSETAMRDALCTQLHINLVDTDFITIDRDLARLVSEPFARRHALVPLLRAKNVVVIAMDDPSQTDVIAAIERAWARDQGRDGSQRQTRGGDRSAVHVSRSVGDATARWRDYRRADPRSRCRRAPRRGISVGNTMPSARKFCAARRVASR